MSLFWATTQDQALLAMVIQEGRPAAEAKRVILGRTAVQKVIYFLQVLGVPMGYRFSIHHYGPFSDDILSDMEWLIADSVVVDQASDARYSNYSPGPQINELLGRHPSFVATFRKQVSTVCSALAPMPPQHLELMATLHYAYRTEKGRGGSGPWKPRVVETFKSFKGEKFSGTDVDRTYDRMAEIGLVEN